jgi:hypothetical protein
MHAKSVSGFVIVGSAGIIIEHPTGVLGAARLVDEPPDLFVRAVPKTGARRSASAAVSILGNSNSTARSRRGGTSVFSSARNMMASPAPLSAFLTALAAKASAWPWIRSSTARLTRLREPLGRPLGLPLCPGSKGRPRFISAVFTAAGVGVSA